MKYWLLLCVSVAGSWAHAQKINPAVVKSAAFYNKAMQQIKPVYKNYVAQASQAFRSRKLNTDSLKSAMKGADHSLFSNLNNTDIETLVLLVMQATATDNDAAISNIMADMEKNRQKKEALRKEEDAVKEAQRKTKDSSKTRTAATMYDPAKRLTAIKKETDALDEMSQQQQLQLQQFMDKKGQLESMISNMMKKQEDTQNTLSSNLKAG